MLSVISAPCQGAGRGFEPRLPLHCFSVALQLTTKPAASRGLRNVRMHWGHNGPAQKSGVQLDCRLAFALAVELLYRITVESHSPVASNLTRWRLPRRPSR